MGKVRGGHFTDEFGVFGGLGFGGGGEFGFHGFETGVFGGVEDALGCGELASLLRLAHVVERVGLQLR